MSKSYRVISASLTTLDVLSMIAGSMKAVDGKEVATELKIPYGTAMCHIATLERAGYVERFGDGYMATLKLAVFYSTKKAQLEAAKQQADNDLQRLGALK